MKKLFRNKTLVKRIISAMMVLVLACGVFTGTQLIGLKASAVRTGSASTSGNYWKYFSDGELEFTANITAITDSTAAPWASNVDKITCVTIDNDNVQSIGANGFSLLKVASVYIPKTVTSIDKDAFSNSSIKTVYYAGTKADWESMYKSTTSGISVVYNHTHTGSVIKHSVAATCKAKGYEGDYYCSLCGAFWKNGNAIATTDHNWSTDYKVQKEATCNASGIKALYCLDCGAFNPLNTVIIPSTGEHNWEVLPKDKFDNCNSHKGDHIVMQCSVCSIRTDDEQFEQTDYIKDEKGNITNKQTADYNKKIALMTEVTTDTAGNAIHHYIIEQEEATCTETGTITTSCAFCNGYNETETIDALGHTDIEDSVFYQTDATCTEPGEKGYMCARCSEIVSSEKIPTLHTEGYWSGTWITDTEPTCVTDGLQKLECNECHKYITDAEGNYITKVLEKTPDVHTNSRWFTILEPTCTENGEKIKICLNEGCPYYSDTNIGKIVAKASDRKALDAMITVTNDTTASDYSYGEDVANDDRVTDVADEINMVMLAAYQSGKESPDEDDIIAVFEMALDHHVTYTYNRSTGENDEALDIKTYDCAGESKGEVRFVFEEIAALAAKKIIAKESVINTSADIVAILEESWTELGDDAIAVVVKANQDEKAKIINKATAKEEIESLKHDYIRVAYIQQNSEFIPVIEEDGKWYRYKKNAESGELIADTENPVDGTPVESVNCIKGDGNMVYMCTRCLSLGDTTLVKQGSHNLMVKEHPATCDAAGYDETYCTLCDYVSNTETDAQLEHNYEYKVIKEATCSKAGIKVKICTLCGDVDKSTYQTLQTVPHTDVDVNEPATCTTEGRKGVECSVCGRFSGEKFAALGHDYVKTVTPPTCTELGYTTSKCSRCGETTEATSFVAVAGHQWTKATNMAASCEKASYTYRKCTVCGEEEETNVGAISPALGHSLVKQSAVAATCTTPGKTEGEYCSRCGDTFKTQTEVPALGHKTKTVAAKAPTCTEAGYESYIVCTVCGTETKEKVDLPATGHNYVTTAGKAATCTEEGYTESIKCTKCGDVRTAATVIPAKGHTWDNGTITTTATAFKSGSKTFTCTVCGTKTTSSYSLTFPQKVLWVINWVFSGLTSVLAKVNG